MYIEKEEITLYITNALTKFLNDSRLISNSTIVLTDLETIVFVASDKKTNYLHENLSDSLKKILNLYMTDISTVDYMNTTTDTIVPIISGDDYSKYKSQIILPILHYEKIVGLLIFIAKDRSFLPSNLEYAKTTQHFVQIFSTKEYLQE